MINVALIDDDLNLIEQFSSYFQSNNNIFLCRVATSVEEFMSDYNPQLPIDVLLLDITLNGGLSGIEALPALKSTLKATDIVMFTVHEDEDSLIQSFRNGATGYLLKDTPFSLIYDYIVLMQKGGSAISAKVASKLINSLNNTSSPSKVLNNKEHRVLELLAEGWSYKLIADRINLSEDGVRFYIKRIYRALNVNSKGEAIHKFYRGI